MGALAISATLRRGGGARRRLRRSGHTPARLPASCSEPTRDREAHGYRCSLELAGAGERAREGTGRRQERRAIRIRPMVVRSLTLPLAMAQLASTFLRLIFARGRETVRSFAAESRGRAEAGRVSQNKQGADEGNCCEGKKEPKKGSVLLTSWTSPSPLHSPPHFLNWMLFLTTRRI